jgi:flagellar M-ring protein FliF
MAIELGKIATQLKGLPMHLRIIIGVVLVAALGAVAFMTMRTPEEHYAVLFTGLSAEDAAKVLEQLKKENTPYKITNAGSTIEVPEQRVHELRISLAATGLPRGGGIGFEVFDKQTFGTTSFVEQMNYRRALSGELARTIAAIDAVESARVHLAMKERSLYKGADEPPSASVVLALRSGRDLAPAQVKGIVHLVASSVEGLRRDRITIVDQSGSVLWSDDTLNVESEGQRELERTLARRIKDMLELIVGPGNSMVVVTAELDNAFKETTEEIYDRDRTALRSETKSEERSKNGEKTPSGVAGARGNLPGAGDPTINAQLGPESMRSSETRNFEVNRVLNRIVGPKSRVKRIHVAVLVNGAFTQTSSSGVTIDGIHMKGVDLNAIAMLAKEAAGLDPERGDRIEVRGVPFAAPVQEIAKNDLKVEHQAPILSAEQTMIAGAAAAGLLLLVMIVGFVLWRKKKKKQKAEALQAEEEAKAKETAQLLEATAKREEMPNLPMSASKLEESLRGHTPAAPSQRDRIIDAARMDAPRAARVLAAWLAENAEKAAPKQEGNASR